MRNPSFEETARLAASQFTAPLQPYIAERERNLAGGEEIVVLISASMPAGSLRALFAQARAYGPEKVRFAVRGFEPRKLGHTIATFRALFPDPSIEHVLIDVDPNVFRQVEAQAVPVFLVKDGEAWFESRGEISLFGAVENVRKRGPIQIGPMYEISEPDVLDVIQKEGAKLDWAGIQARLADKALRGDVKAQVTLPAVGVTATARHAPRVALQRDVVVVEQGQYKVLASAGTGVNPLAHSKFDRVVVVIDGQDPAQVALAKAWVERHGERAVDVFFAGSAEVPQLQRAIGAAVYPLYQWMAEAFGVEAVPALIRPDGQELVIQYVKAGELRR